jgi:hypothetical protein
MKNRPDPLLDAVLGPAAGAENAALAALLAGARARRRRRALGRAAGGAGLLLGALAWAAVLLRPPAPPAPAGPRPYTLVRTAAVGLAQVTTRAGTVAAVSTAARPGDYEVAADEGRLLALLPGGAGFIGEAGERRLVWFGAP